NCLANPRPRSQRGVCQRSSTVCMQPIPYFERPLFFFDQSRFRQALQDGDPVVVFKDAINAANKQFDRRVIEGEDVRTVVYERALFLDCLLHYAWYRFEWHESLSQGISLIAVGGYGRGELHPHSDIDLLILLQESNPAPYRDNIERFITLLWDIGLEIGHSV